MNLSDYEGAAEIPENFCACADHDHWNPLLLRCDKCKKALRPEHIDAILGDDE